MISFSVWFGRGLLLGTDIGNREEPQTRFHLLADKQHEKGFKLEQRLIAFNSF